MNRSLYFWKWADNPLPGRPREVHAALLRGEMPAALQPFDARPLLRKLAAAAVRGARRGEEWSWQPEPRDAPERARFVFVSCPPPPRSGTRRRRLLAEELVPLGISGCEEESGLLAAGLRPKRNCFTTGQSSECWYDVTAKELPDLIRGVDPHGNDPFGILEDARGYFVQFYAERRRFCVEWAQNEYHPREVYDQWRAMDPARHAARGGVIEDGELPYAEEPDLLRLSDLLRILRVFLRGEPRPARYPWRNVNDLIGN